MVWGNQYNFPDQQAALARRFRIPPQFRIWGTGAGRLSRLAWRLAGHGVRRREASRGRRGNGISARASSPKCRRGVALGVRSEEHTSELKSLMRISYAVFCLQKQIKKTT